MRTSVGTIRRCDRCGEKFQLPVPSSDTPVYPRTTSPSGSSGFIVAGIAAVALLGFCCVGGFFIIGALAPRYAPHAQQVGDQAKQNIAGKAIVEVAQELADEELEQLDQELERYEQLQLAYEKSLNIYEQAYSDYQKHFKEFEAQHAEYVRKRSEFEGAGKLRTSIKLNRSLVESAQLNQRPIPDLVRSRYQEIIDRYPGTQAAEDAKLLILGKAVEDRPVPPEPQAPQRPGPPPMPVPPKLPDIPKNVVIAQADSSSAQPPQPNRQMPLIVSGGRIHVRSYTRKDGTHVRAHTRSLPKKK